MDDNQNTFKSYWPLISLILIAGLGATALQLNPFSNSYEMRKWMHYFRGFFLTVFAMLKIFNLSGFAEGFVK